MRAIRRCGTLGLAVVLFVGVGSAAGERPLNEPPPGFRALFNGKDLSGWKGLVKNPVKRRQMSEEALEKAQKKADERMRKHWSVKDGILIFDGKGHTHLCTKKKYRNFELLVDWKIQSGGDSGIYLRGSPQVQIWDPNQHPEGSGGLFNNKEHPSKPRKRADNPVGHWNTFRIKMIDQKVWVWLNGEKVVDGVVMENYYKRDKPIYPKEQIHLQTHGSKLYFRNIFIRELPSDLDTPAPAGEWKWLFHGRKKDLSNWTFNEGGWKVEGNTLALKEGGGFLWSRHIYRDFVLDLDVKLADGANSGVFIRTDKQNPVQGGLEVQLLDSHGKNGTSKHDMGALYDLKGLRENRTKPPGEWQDMRIRADGDIVKVTLNGGVILKADLSRWQKAGKNPDGTDNKFKRAIANFARSGYIGIQDHGDPIWLRNIRVKRLH